MATGYRSDDRRDGGSWYTARDFALVRGGKTIRGRLIEPTGAIHGTVLFSGPFGRTMADLFLPSYFLLSNGLAVIEYDPTDHLGLSDGEMLDYTFTGHYGDLVTVADAFSDMHPILFSMSIAAVPTFRVAVDRPVAGIVLLVPVVSPFRTVEAMTGCDWREHFHSAPETLPTEISVMGYTVSSNIIGDGIMSGFGDDGQILAGVRSVTCPVRVVASDADEWVDYAEIQAVVEAFPDAELTVIPGATHEFQRNPFVGARYFMAVTQAIFSILKLDRVAHQPRFAEIVEAREHSWAAAQRSHSGG